MATVPDDDFDMPDLTDEMMMEFRPLTELAQTDLHMGAAVVRTVTKPKVEPVDLSSIVIDAVIGTMYLGAAWLFVRVWAWVLFN
jgi:hypothetical protein